MLAILLVACIKTEDKVENPKEPGKIYDLFEHDAFQYGDITSKDISIKGVVLGDTSERIMELMGEPDNTTIESSKAIIYSYSKSLDLENSGIHFITYENKIDSMVVMRSFNKYLKGESRIDRDLRSIYDFFGIPEKQEDIPKLRKFIYANKVDVLHRASR